MRKKKKVNAAILIIGNEILSGRTQDKNIAFLSNWLNMNCGITVSEVRIIPDVEKTIVKNIRLLSKEFNYVFTTGGIGPTHDDITAKSIAKAFKLKYGFHKEAYKILENYYGKEKFNDGRKKMAKMPKIAKLIYLRSLILLPKVKVPRKGPKVYQKMIKKSIKKYMGR